MTGQQQQSGGAQDTQQAALLQQLLEQNKKLSERLDRMDSDRTTATRKQQLSGLVEKLPENIRKAYQRTPVEGMTDEQFQTLVGEITTEVGDITSSLKQKGAVFGKPAAQNGGSSSGAELTKEQLEAISHREATPSDKGQPF